MYLIADLLVGFLFVLLSSYRYCLAEAPCAESCNNGGTCDNGVCNCNEDFAGPTCNDSNANKNLSKDIFTNLIIAAQPVSIIPGNDNTIVVQLTGGSFSFTLSLKEIREFDTSKNIISTQRYPFFSGNGSLYSSITMVYLLFYLFFDAFRT